MMPVFIVNTRNLLDWCVRGMEGCRGGVRLSPGKPGLTNGWMLFAWIFDITHFDNIFYYAFVIVKFVKQLAAIDILKGGGILCL